jgi:hypothetical protein
MTSEWVIEINPIDGVMVSVFSSSVVDRDFEPDLVKIGLFLLLLARVI